MSCRAGNALLLPLVFAVFTQKHHGKNAERNEFVTGQKSEDEMTRFVRNHHKRNGGEHCQYDGERMIGEHLQDIIEYQQIAHHEKYSEDFFDFLVANPDYIISVFVLIL